MADPIRIGVKVEPDMSAMADFSEQMRRQKSDAAASAASVGSAGPGPAASAAAPDVATWRSVLRHMAEFDDALITIIDRLNRFSGAVRNATTAPGMAGATTPAPALPLTTPSGATPGLPAPAATPTPPAPTPTPTPTPSPATTPQRMLTSILFGSLGMAGLGLGLGAAFGEGNRMSSTSRDFAERAMRAAAAGGGDAGDVRTLSRDILSAGDFPRFSSPRESVGILEQLRRMAPGYSARNAMLSGEVGATSLGSAQAGGQFASELFQTYRSTRGAENLTSLVEYGRQTGQGISELVQLFSSLVNMAGDRGGVATRSRDDERSTLNAMAWLRSLPGGIGEGRGGQQITEGAMGAVNRPGLSQLILMQEFERRTGLTRMTPHGEVEFQKLLADPVRAPQMVTEGFERVVGKGEPDVLAMVLQREGIMSPLQADKFAHGTRDERRSIIDQAGPDAERKVADRNRELENTLGGESVTARNVRELGEASYDVAAKLRIFGDQLIGKSPAAAAAAEALGGIALGVPGWRTLAAAGLGGAAMRWGPRLGRAGVGARAGAGASSLGALGPLLGVGEMGKDAYDLVTGGDPTNTGDMVSGGLGALAGLLLSGGNPMAGAAGYGGGKLAWQTIQSLFGSADPAEAATRAGGGASGWRGDQVLEHLALLRQLVRSGAAATALDGVPDGGAFINSRVGPREPVTQDFSESWGIGPASGRTALRHAPFGRGPGGVRPDDPRIAEAARRHGLPLALVLAMIEQESGFNQNKTGRDGEIGIMQLMPGTARSRGVNPYTIEGNLEGGTGYLEDQLKRTHGDVRRALAGYNGGPGGPGPDQRPYADEVLAKTPHWLRALRAGEISNERLAKAAASVDDGEDRPAVRGGGRGGDSAGGKVEHVVTLDLTDDARALVRPSRMITPGARVRAGG